ncbi:DUF3427 domain-containing protein [Vibrio europaeus]|uniref:DUF3427 domain-containing protein n=1 Tax=Vibrio europaeus TaxID=300876 RepID=UPI0018A70E83|nr:DUF3427 domain-containing protein [Vibrio europaeus]MDC5813049.1 DUF3427 domain-containing protein [Vibrio europaeus]QPG36056.1 DUF3427 domain-containing protein [Vibrio europaeus]
MDVTVELDKSGKIRKLKTLAKPLTSTFIDSAITKYEKANGQIESYHASTGYDLRVGDKRYPPKCIFGLAMSELLNYPILSNHFSGGVDSPCFKVLEELNYEIVTKPRPSAQNGLHLYNSYSREELSSLFDPGVEFTSGSGRWGSSGIVPNAPRKDDFAFVVTLEDKSSYDDYMTEDGVLFWKSQDQHTPASSQVRTLCNHDESVNTIYLFMREKQHQKYTFFGTLAFKDWNPATSNPVHFQWSMLSWPLPEKVRADFKNHIRPAIDPSYQPPVTEELELSIVSPPKTKKRSKSKVHKKFSNAIDWAKRDERNRALGQAGELFALNYEKQKLAAANLYDLIEKVEHIAMVDSSAGYDIKSFDLDGKELFIEVKTTTSNISTPFYISRNEVEVSVELNDNYVVYRLFDFKVNSTKNQFYKLNGAVLNNFDLVAENYSATVKNH